MLFAKSDIMTNNKARCKKAFLQTNREAEQNVRCPLQFGRFTNRPNIPPFPKGGGKCSAFAMGGLGLPKSGGIADTFWERGATKRRATVRPSREDGAKPLVLRRRAALVLLFLTFHVLYRIFTALYYKTI